MKTSYEVEYYYYQYNSGMADNGHKIGIISKPTLSEAKEIVRQIGLSKEETHIGVEQTTDAILDYISYDGYFTKSPVIYEVIRKKLDE